MKRDEDYPIYTPTAIFVDFNVQHHYFHDFYSSLNTNLEAIKS
jgi:hypothetical protein